MRLPDEFYMKIQSPEFVGGTALGDLAEWWYSHHQRCALKPSGRVVVMMRLPNEFDLSEPVTGVRGWHGAWQLAGSLVLPPHWSHHKAGTSSAHASHARSH